VRRLSRQCGILNILQPYRPPRSVTEIALLLLYPSRTDWAQEQWSCTAPPPHPHPSVRKGSDTCTETHHWARKSVARAASISGFTARGTGRRPATIHASQHFCRRVQCAAHVSRQGHQRVAAPAGPSGPPTHCACNCCSVRPTRSTPRAGNLTRRKLACV
jgi:hypothetical protein